MKNIHVLPTSQPSRLHKIGNELGLTNTPNNNFLAKQQNLYITSDEVVKVGDWVIEFQKNDKIGEVHFINGEYVIAKDIQKKIILTTDPTLITDGVQAIDDKFLEWFVKNPSCEEVEVGYGWIRLTETDNEGYWVSIPNKQFEMQQEEPKQETLEEVELAIMFHNTYERLAPSFGYETRADTKLFDITTPNGMLMIAVCKKIIKWQQERSYSEDEVITILDSYNKYLKEVTKEQSVEEWFEQFKK